MITKLLSFFFMLTIAITSTFSLPLKNYDQRKLFADSDFENGFSVVSQGDGYNLLGDFTYYDNASEPIWCIAQWGKGQCLWENKIESDEFTLTDEKTKTVRYNPEDKSISMRLNAANIYNGEPAETDNWPHLLLEQSPLCDYNTLSDGDKSFYRCDSDALVLDLDIRLKEFVDTTNKDGVNAVEFLAYFYLKGVDGNKFIWFGVNLFDSRGYRNTNWSYDKSSGQMIYCVSTKDTYKLKAKSLYRFGKPYVSEEWSKVHIDLKPHIELALKRANESNTYGEEVSFEDFYIGGVNIGFEVHGNYDCTVDIKNFNITSYNKNS